MKEEAGPPGRMATEVRGAASAAAGSGAGQGRDADRPGGPGSTSDPAGSLHVDAGGHEAGGTAADHEDGRRDLSKDGDPRDHEALKDLIRPQGRASAVAGSVRARTVFAGPTTIQSLVVKDERRSFQVPLINLSALHGTGPFVAPPGYEALVEAVETRRVVVCSGPIGSGRERALTRALMAAGHKTIQMLPAGLTFTELGHAVAGLVEQADACVLQVPESSMLRGLAGAAGQAIRSVAAAGELTIAAVACPTRDTLVARTMTVVGVEPPAVEAVARAWAREVGASAGTVDRILEVLARLTSARHPADVAAVVEEVQRNPSRSAEEVAAQFDGSAVMTAVGEWLQNGRSVDEVAMVAAAAALSGHAVDLVHHHGEALGRKLERRELSAAEASVIGARTLWPEPLLRVRIEEVVTHFGVRPLRIVEVAPPIRPQDLVRALWELLDSGFRVRFCQWLSNLAETPEVRWDAAFTAGVLFSLDPVIAESQILRPWAEHASADFRRCAGMALGAPIAIGDDPAPARRLATVWSVDASLELRHAATVAYGGLLGAWDTASSAPWQLVRIGALTPPLRLEADLGLANLVVAGAEAVSARSTVLAYLRLLADGHTERQRVFGCLPLLIGALLRPQPVCRESFDAVQRERDNWDALLSMVALALVTPEGVPYGSAVIGLLLHGAARGRLDLELVEDVVRSLKDARRPHGDVPRLGATLRRVLSASKRSHDREVGSVAAELMRRFFE